MALHDVFDDEGMGGDSPFLQLSRLMIALGSDPVRSGSASLSTARTALRKLVEAVPMLAEAPAFAAPAGMHDLPQILATAYYGRTLTEWSVDNYRRAINRMHWLLLVVQAEWLIAPEAKSVKERLLARINNDQEDLELPARLQPRITLTGRDLVPTPAAIIAAIGVTDEPLIGGSPTLSPRAEAFRVFVSRVHEALIVEPGLTEVRPDAPISVRYLAHMNVLLHDTAPRLASGVLPCDRTPIVSPWYASTVLAVRAYAWVLATVLGVPGISEPTGVAFTFFSLAALADPGVEAGLSPDVPERLRPIGLRPLSSICAARSKSMYVCSPAQSGPWWVLLRATLSGLSVRSADALADRLVQASSDMQVVVRNAVLLCVIMHTQTGMRIVGRRTDPLERRLANFPLAKLVARIKDPVCGQTPLDMLMTTYSGTSDLASLASDDLAFNDGAIARQEHAWMQELAVRVEGVQLPAPPPASPDPETVHQTVDNFCDALRAIGIDWLRNCVQSQSDTTEEGVDYHIAVSPAEMLSALCRASTAHATLHCGTWLSTAFAFAVELEKHYQGSNPGLGERPLLRSPLAGVLASEKVKDEAWLRSHFCYLAEQALHGARRGGMWAAGSHLVLAAWVATQPEDPEGKAQEDVDADDSNGVRLFARAITPHTVRDTGPESSRALLLTPDWRREVDARGWDSVVECARAFERALHDRNTSERHRHAHVLADFIGSDSEEPEPLGPPMPVVLTHSVDRNRAGATAAGAGRFDEGRVPSLDVPSELAMERFRLRCQDAEAHANILVVSTAYAHGAAVAVLAVPCDDEDVEHERKVRKAGRLVSDRGRERGALLARLAKFAQS